MPRSALHSYVALLLLLCLGRTLLPEAWVVAWHPHPHTTCEPAHASRLAKAAREPLFTVRHQHCHAEQFYNAPYVLNSMAALPLPRLRLHLVVLPSRRVGRRGATAVRGPNLRGPPARS